MARTLAEMASKGVTKAKAKDDNIKKSWDAAKTRCIENYAAMPFGSTRKSNHAAAVRAASFRTDWDKWEKNWKAKMAE